jgi:hypothetical protein
MNRGVLLMLAGDPVITVALIVAAAFTATYWLGEWLTNRPARRDK